jgi:hypothetical protein
MKKTPDHIDALEPEIKWPNVSCGRYFRPTLNDICIGTYGSLSPDLNSGSGPSPDWFKMKNSDAPL